jgi:hypothetical protein
MSHRWALVVLLGGLSVGCFGGQNVTTGSALVHQQFPYAVTYDDEQEKSVLGDDWALENYRKITAPDKKVSLERKTGYETTYEFDFDDDDKQDAEATLPNPDLVLVSKKTNARIELRTLLLDKRLANKELRVLLTNIVESGTGTRALFVGFGKATLGAEKRFASRLLDSSPATLDGNPGLVATVEHANLDQLELNPDARWRRSRLFLVHAPFDYFASETLYQEKFTSKYHKYRVLLLVEYSNMPEDFEAQYPEFLRLLNKIHLLKDDELLSYLAEPLSKCSKGTTNVLKLTISKDGQASIDKSEGLEIPCASPIVSAYRFAATGASRTIDHKYDFSKGLEPAWLTENGYAEERKPPTEKLASDKSTGEPLDAKPEAPTTPEPAAADGADTADPAPSTPPAKETPSADTPAGAK